MSSPVFELMKRPDELFIVEHAHLQPRFVEDSVRFAMKETLDRYPELAPTTTCSRSRRTSRRSIVTTSSPSGPARSASCGPSSHGSPRQSHTELRDWLSASS